MIIASISVDVVQVLCLLMSLNYDELRGVDE